MQKKRPPSGGLFALRSIMAHATRYVGCGRRTTVFHLLFKERYPVRLEFMLGLALLCFTLSAIR